MNTRGCKYSLPTHVSLVRVRCGGFLIRVVMVSILSVWTLKHTMITVVTSPRCGYSHRWLIYTCTRYSDTKHTIDTMDYSGVLSRNIRIVIGDHLQLLCIWRTLASRFLENLYLSWIPETLFELCFECMCVLTIWMLRRFNLLCQVKFTSFRLRLAFLKDFIKIGISSELNSDSLSHRVLHVTCVVSPQWDGDRWEHSQVWPCIVAGTRFIGQYSPGRPLHLVTMWPRVMSPAPGSSSESAASQPSTLCRLSNYL